MFVLFSKTKFHRYAKFNIYPTYLQMDILVIVKNYQLKWFMKEIPFLNLVLMMKSQEIGFQD